MLQVRAAGGQQLQVMVAHLGAQGHRQVGEEAAAAQGLAQLRTVEAPAHLVVQRLSSHATKVACHKAAAVPAMQGLHACKLRHDVHKVAYRTDEIARCWGKCVTR